MSEDAGHDADRRRSAADAELEREIRKERRFSLSEAIGRLAGPGCMKGASPVSRVRQAAAELEHCLDTHLTDGPGAVRAILLRNVRESDLLLDNLDQPRVVLAAWTQRVLESDFLLKDFVREADEEWGQQQGERPFFDKDGAAPHPDDPYTFESVRGLLSGLVERLADDQDNAPQAV